MTGLEKAPETADPAVPDSPAVTHTEPHHEPGGGGERIVVDGHLMDERDEDTPLSRAAAAAVLSVAWQIGRGHLVWARSAAGAVSHAIAREQLIEAHAAGDGDAAGAWYDRLEAARDSRHRRIRELPGTLAAAAKAAGAVAVAGIGAVLLAGIIVGITTPLGWGWTAYWAFWWLAIQTGVTVAALGAVALLVAVPVIWLTAAYRAGRTLGPVPGWIAAQPAGEDDETAVVTPLGVAEALAHLGLSPLSRAIREGWQVAFEVPPVRVNGRGYQVVFSLPLGVTPDMVADKKPVLARNLHRDPTEVWPAAATRAGFVDLWVSDAGSSKKPAPEYPLLHDGAADVFDGVPVGVSQRGDMVMFPIVGANFSAGGRMGQGKSNLCRVIMLGAATDPLCRLRVHVFAGNGDFDAYRPRLELYNRGTDESVAWAGLNDLMWLYEETGRREDRLAEIGAKKVTRAVAEKYPDLRPIVTLFSECHELFGCGELLDPEVPKAGTVGKAAIEYAVKTLRRARKTGLTLGFDTQQARADAIPPKIIGLVGVNACFSVKSWRDNDGFLGDGSFAAGIRATELRFNVDRGTCIVTGATSELFEIVKTHFVAVDDDAGWDAATEVIARCMQAFQPAGPAAVALDRAASVDHLANIAAALRGEDVVPTRVVLGRLAEADRSYEDWDFSDLKAYLSDHDAEPRKAHGVMSVDAARIRRALTNREQNGDEGEADTIDLHRESGHPAGT